MYQLLALDLDGTSLKSDFTISPVLVDTVRVLSRSIPVLIVTGRHHTAAGPYYQALGLTTPAICCNGTYVYDYQNRAVLQHNAIEKSQAVAFLQLAQARNLNVVVYLKDAMLYSSQRPVMHVARLAEWAEGFSGEVKPIIRQVDDFSPEVEGAECIWKFVVEGDDVDEFAALPFIQQHFTGEKSWSNRIDFASIGNTKGAALAQLIKHKGISPEQVVAVGDHHNDISMLEMVGMGVAMANADENLKRHANMITRTTNDNDHTLAELLQTLFPEHLKSTHPLGDQR
ncbi:MULTISPECIES: Cof-type HAD-IIB family hydrolase [unclassified Marinomonas]|jgi:Cof subfamily protein (haloacid dehalogenase superfamily)|uniref:Cof-type HAD-IIB family hydrolase n=1 Tax=unclassified Marinomonas TaxID=196814 RepID=UPI0037CC0433